MEKSQQIVLTLAAIFILGTAAQWLAWRMRIPAILLLLVTGFLAGPVTGFLEPGQFFGDLLLPMVSLCVGLILFEGGLNLKMDDLKQIWCPLLGLLTIGVLVTWIGGTIGGIWLLGLSPAVALVLGAILTVTGPTVVGPLLRDIRPSGTVGTIAKWEGIMIDPAGATLAILVFHAVDSSQHAEVGSASLMALEGLLTVIVTGVGLGLACAWLLVQAIHRGLAPEWLHNSITLLFVFLAFIVSEAVHHEAGLLATTVMGMAVANQKKIATQRIVEFKENLVAILLAVLFVVLAARVSLDSIISLGWRGPLFALFLIVIVRPLSVWLSTWSKILTVRDRWFLSWLAPRGIVAAAVSSVFALRLGVDGDSIAPATFCVVFLTVSVYGLTTPWLARRLGVSKANPQGFLIAGVNKTSRILGRALMDLGYRVILVDSQPTRVRQAMALGFEAHCGNIISETLIEKLDLADVGSFLGMTANDEVNTLAVARFRELFGNQGVFQLARQQSSRPSDPNSWENRMMGAELFSNQLDYEALDERFSNGWILKRLSSDHYEQWNRTEPNSMLEIWPLFQLEGSSIRPVTTKEEPVKKEGLDYLCLVVGNMPADYDPVMDLNLGDSKSISE